MPQQTKATISTVVCGRTVFSKCPNFVFSSETDEDEDEGRYYYDYSHRNRYAERDDYDDGVSYYD